MPCKPNTTYENYIKFQLAKIRSKLYDNGLLTEQDDLDKALGNLQTRLSCEYELLDVPYDFSLRTIRELSRTVDILTDCKACDQEKFGAITHFERFTRNARFSEKTKGILAAVAATLTIAAICAGAILIPLVALGIVITGAILSATVTASSIAGIFLGLGAAFHFGQNPHEKRDQGVSSQLRCALQQQKLQQQPKKHSNQNMFFSSRAKLPTATMANNNNLPSHPRLKSS
jgi:hypothetical protein